MTLAKASCANLLAPVFRGQERKNAISVRAAVGTRWKWLNKRVMIKKENLSIKGKSLKKPSMVILNKKPSNTTSSVKSKDYIMASKSDVVIGF
eukprot:m.317412 g.317412  ORF g.317412 m.317412 type:complete len:93 (+) comp16434_c0_seq12:74-352(+)